MAHMIPPVPKEFDTLSNEGAVFRALQKLNDDYYVFHSYSATVVTDDKQYVEHELDFVIVNQKKGILVLEVKAGDAIRYHDRTWFYSSGKVMPHGGPFQQAATAKRTIRDKIQFHHNKKVQALANKIRFFHAVFFHDMVKSQFENLNGLPEEVDMNITLFSDDLLNPSKRIGEIFSLRQSWEKYKDPIPLTDDEFELLMKGVLCPEFHLVESPTAKAFQIEQNMNQLLREQYKILEFLDEQNMAVINGAAGTGKTMLAVEKARRHSMNGEKVLFLCYNRLLCKQLEESHSGKQNKQYKNIDFKTISKLAKKITGDYSNYSGLENWLLECISQPSLFPYKHIIIDEGQDFGLIDSEKRDSSASDDVSIIDAMQEVVLNAGGTFYLFYDRNQMIQGGKYADYKLPDCIQNSDCRLTLHTNCRNTREIAQTSYTPLKNSKKKPLKPGPVLSAATPIVPTMHISRNLVDSLDEILEELEKDQVDDIVILTQKTLNSTGIADRFYQTDDSSDDYRYYRHSGKNYRVTTCIKFKGLEANSIVLIDLDKESFKDRKGLEFYVGTSRARIHLDFICSLSDQDYREIIQSIDPEAPPTKNPEKLRTMLGSLFSAKIEVEQ